MRTQQFKEALSTRDMIGQAKGILMERYELDDETAFNTLIKLSQSMNTRCATSPAASSTTPPNDEAARVPEIA